MEVYPIGLVDIVRDFLATHRLMRSLFARYRAGELGFADLAELICDNEASALFRLKERCHSLFRAGAEGMPVTMRREALFDLAVGSLFHEAMKFRENFYQREVYGPRVRALRSESGGEADALFEEFEKILLAVSDRLEEGLHESEILLSQTRDRLRILLTEHREVGLVPRYLIEHRAEAEDVFGVSIDELLAEIYGDAAEGYAVAGWSWVLSGYYLEAQSALAESLQRDPGRRELKALSAYARGMAAYLAGSYREALEELEQWATSGPKEGTALADLAKAAVSRIGGLVHGDDAQQVGRAASKLLKQIR
jgi:tetratricopeptide (TPR) repeat protein